MTRKVITGRVSVSFQQYHICTYLRSLFKVLRYLRPKQNPSKEPSASTVSLFSPWVDALNSSRSNWGTLREASKNMFFINFQPPSWNCDWVSLLDRSTAGAHWLPLDEKLPMTKQLLSLHSRFKSSPPPKDSSER